MNRTSSRRRLAPYRLLRRLDRGDHHRCRRRHRHRGTQALATPRSREPTMAPSRGMAVAGSGVDAFLGIPYAAPPTGNAAVAATAAPVRLAGVRDATSFAPSCPQNPGPFLPPGPMSEDCLYLNVYTPALSSRHGAAVTDTACPYWCGSTAAG